MKKIISLTLISILAITLFAGCAGGEQSPGAAASGFDANREITVVSREDGSGTRGAFVELTGVQVTTDGNTTDRTSPEASIQNGTNAIMTNVAGNMYAIGYISTGSINDTIKPINVDGVEPTAANIIAGTYKISRPFIIVTQDNLEPVAEDFINFIMSAEGQEIIADSYIPIAGNEAFSSNGAGGKIIIGGSTSVTPVMEKLAEAYRVINPGADIEIQGTGSGAGITGAIDGILDIGMSSREIRDSEMEQLHQQITICMDGIAMIVNKENPITNISMDDVRDIFIGEITRWSEVG